MNIPGLRQVPLPDPTVTIAGVEKRITSLAELNERYALLEARGSASVYISRPDHLPITENDLRRRVAGEVVQTGVKKEEPVYANAYQFWSAHARRHIYKRIEFTSRELPPDTLNLFKGFGVKPRAGCCDRILAHIHEVFCSGDATASDAMLKLMAWQMQNVGKPSRVIVIMKTTEHQAGKGLLLGETLLPIYGPSGFTPATTDQVLGRFNDAIVGRVYIFLDEVMFSGDRRAADAIKRLATATSYGIEAKGLPIIQCPVGVNFWAATNHDTAAFIEEADARYWVLDVSESKVGDSAYFIALMREIENGGREALAHRLLNMDVTNFVPLRDTPKNNDAKQEMIRRSINPFDARKWLEECCISRQLIGSMLADDPAYAMYASSSFGPTKPEGWTEWVAGKEYYFHVFINAYTAWQRDVKSPVRPEPTSKVSLGEVLTNAGFGSRRDSKSSIRVLPDPDECLAALFTPKGRRGTDGQV